MVLLAVSTASAYMIGVIVCVVMLLVAAFVAKSIAFKPDLSDVTKRKVWFWIFAILTPILTFLSAFLFVYNGIRAHNQQDAYMVAMCISSGISIVLYIILGFIVSKVDGHGKIGNWFSKKK